MTKYTTEYDKIFCTMARKYNLKKLFLKSVAICESGLNKDAYRFEPGFWERYLRNNPLWKDKDMALVSASHGLFQTMYVTAWELLDDKFDMTREDLCDPVFNVELGAKYIRKILDKVNALRLCEKFFWLSPIEICMSRYNGGVTSNPDDNGNLRNQKYADRILRTWDELEKVEKECGDA